MMSFCKKCGASMGKGNFCPQCGEAKDANSNNMEYVMVKHSKFLDGKKKFVLGIIMIAILGVVFFPRTTTVNKPCDWCRRSPSVAYKTKDGSNAYVCKKCSKECALCGDKATKHYENLVGMMVFVCDDCYKDVTEG